MPEIRAYFVIWGAECDPDEITKQTGIAPTKSWRTGDVRYTNTGQVHRDSGWRIDTSPDLEMTLDAHIDALLNRVWHASEHLKTLRSHCEIQVTIVIHCRDTTPPAMMITPANIWRLGAIGAGVDIDLYC